MYRKSIPLYHYLLILSFFFLALFQVHHTLKTNHLILQNLKVHSNIHSKVTFQNDIKQFNQIIKGQFQYKHNNYPFKTVRETEKGEVFLMDKSTYDYKKIM
mgnify:CR=1 FL=1